MSTRSPSKSNRNKSNFVQSNINTSGTHAGTGAKIEEMLAFLFSCPTRAHVRARSPSFIFADDWTPFWRSASLLVQKAGSGAGALHFSSSQEPRPWLLSSAKNLASNALVTVFADDWTRTSTLLLEKDFESIASTNSATSAQVVSMS